MLDLYDFLSSDLQFSCVLIFQRMDSQEKGRSESTVMHEIIVLPVIGRPDNAAVDVSERRNPVILHAS